MEARQERFDRDWNQIRDTRKARGWDYQSNERKDRDFSQWASTPVDPETPAEGITTLSLPALLTPEGNTRVSLNQNSGSYVPSEDGDWYMVLFDNIGDNRFAVKWDGTGGIVYGFIFKILSVPEEYAEALADAIGSYLVSPTDEPTNDGDWYFIDLPDEASVDEFTGMYQSLGFELEYVGIGAAVMGEMEARLEPRETP